MSKTHTIGEHDTISFDDEYPHTVRIFIRSQPDKVDRVLELNAEFEQPWQAGKTRKLILAAGKIDLSKWSEGAEYEPPAF